MVDLSTGDTQTIIRSCKKHKVGLKHTAYILATAYWETNHTVKPVREAYWLSEAWRKEHLKYYPWYGRGYVQLTWEANYKLAGEKLGVDLTTDPDKALDASVASEVLVVGSTEGWFTGKKLSDFDNYKSMRKVINGTDRATEIAAIAEDYEKLLLTSGYTTSTTTSSLMDFILSLFRK